MAQLHDELLAQKPEGARHDADVCPFCADKAGQLSASVPSGHEPSGAPETEMLPTSEGGTNPIMADNANETLSRETHEALIAKAVSDATATLDASLAKKTEEASELAAKVEKLEADNASLKTDNDRLNSELDTAQVALKAATDEVASLKEENAQKDEAARKEKVSVERAKQVANLGLFPQEYVDEKASRWAEFSDEDWAERIEEWQKAKPEGATTPSKTDSASAMSGTSGDLGQDEAGKKISNRQAVLALK